MKKALLSLILLYSFVSGACQKGYWQQHLQYKIDVTLNTADKTLDGFEKIVYQNNSPDTLRFIWFYLWPNAYKNDRTAFSDGLLQNDDTRFYFSNKEQRGYINRLDFKVNGSSTKTEDHPQHIDIVKVLLPQPLAPGQQVSISTPFHVKLPFNFSRSGYEGNSFQLTQWYPKPAVYDAKGWRPMPYLDQGEFYSEFGSYDVTVTVPGNYVVAATGSLQTPSELALLKQGVIPKTVITKNLQKKNTTAKTTTQKTLIQAETLLPKTLRYQQDSVHDFAFFANKDFIVVYDTCQLPSGKIIDVFSYYTASQKETWNKAIAYAKDAVRFYSAEVGEYPYNTLSVVQGPQSFGGGMEYPTITVISPIASPKLLDITIAHEIGHNWFYGILASNEREHPWMDEGLNSFYERKYTRQQYGDLTDEEEVLLQTLATQRRDQPISTSAEAFTKENYGLVAYYKSAKWLELIESKIGTEVFRNMMQKYYKSWAFRHPQPEDFNAIVQETVPAEAHRLLALQKGRGTLSLEKKPGPKLIMPLQPKSIAAYLKNPSKQALFVSPIIGANAYDKLMIGGVITNIKLPPSALQVIMVPLYSTGAKKLRVIGRASYSIYPAKGIKKAEALISGSTFSNNEFRDEKSKKHLASFAKLAPGVTLYFNESDPHSKRVRTLQWKSFFIQEEPFRISYDSLFSSIDTVVVQNVETLNLRYTVHQLRLGIENYRALYPYSAFLMAQGSKNFLRLTFEGNYFFNYAKGGLAVRLFTGKFFYDEAARYDYGYHIDRFALNMTGANGEEDFTYNHYFVGRNRFEGAASQQIAIRDGGFKIRTDLLGQKVGKSGNWLAAMNFSTSLPQLPIRLFADIGTYAEAWEQDASTDRFLFDAGLHIPIFKVVNIYLPVVYSRPFADYVRSNYIKNRLLRTATFSINLQQLTSGLRKQRLF